jgi:hypothetical protein
LTPPKLPKERPRRIDEIAAAARPYGIVIRKSGLLGEYSVKMRGRSHAPLAYAPDLDGVWRLVCELVEALTAGEKPRARGRTAA